MLPRRRLLITAVCRHNDGMHAVLLHPPPLVVEPPTTPAMGFYPAATTTLSTAAQCVLVVGGILLARATVRQEHGQRPLRLPSGSGRRQLRLSSNVPAGNQLRRRQLRREDRARHYVWGHGDSAHLLGGGAIAIPDVFLVGGLDERCIKPAQCHPSAS
ncbi:Os10g0172500 [Oryza sativa Japonica Group]|uniref:Os10g0172500 protein n=3 Tax=Oryza sativa subsp. japonica TaxID=39947 RepID=A0A0P0XST5_ORYSJ|nr:Os10g0172500 [Oryza sativa Japonica Group]